MGEIMSSFIKLNKISFSFDNHSSNLFSNVSVSFHTGWTSICGPNGCGKTSLLKLIEGKLKPNSGLLDVCGKLVSVPQSTTSKPSHLDNFLFDYSKRAIKIREQLNLDDSWHERWETLSIGERKRLQIALALAQNPDILLIDEPTNHIDASTKKIIFTSLKAFRGIGILISHDRLLLNHLCYETCFLESSSLKYFSAPYDTAKSELSSEIKSKTEHKEKLKKEEKRINRAIQEQVEKIAKGKKKLSKRNLSTKDHDAKDKINLAKLTGAGLSDSRKKKVLSDRKNRLESRSQAISLKKTYDLGVFFQKTPRVNSLFFPEKLYDLKYLAIEQEEVRLSKGDKIALTGDNGSGKSTLLTKWLEIIPDEYTYAPQEFSSEETQRLTDRLLRLDKEIRGKIFTLVSCFGSDPKSLVAGSLPSPGVWQKIIIAEAIVKKSSILVLDEPTNHMDLDAIEILEEALGLFQGILICISHDESFIKKLCNLKLHLVKKSNKTKANLTYI